jgi:hypothetical protein
LDIGEHCWICCFQEIEPRATRDHKTEVLDQLLVVLLADAVEIDDLAIGSFSTSTLDGSLRKNTCAPPATAST